MEYVKPLKRHLESKNMENAHLIQKADPKVVEGFSLLRGAHRRVHDHSRGGSIIYLRPLEQGVISTPKTGALLEFFVFGVFAVAALSEVALTLLGGN
jgi:hypothetical protein